MMGAVVIKVGGSLKGASLDVLADAVSHERSLGRHVVLVHGGGPRITEALQQHGIELPFVDGQRVTTPEAVGLVEQVLASSVNREIVTELQQAGIPAKGMSGASGILLARALPGMERTGFVESVQTAALVQQLDRARVPVLAPIGVDAQGQRYNINADIAAAAVAGALRAERIAFLTDVPGIYEHWEARRLLTAASAERLVVLLADGRFSAGMIPKVNAVLHAVQHGVAAAYIVDGRDGVAVRWAIQSAVTVQSSPEERSYGTCIVAEQPDHAVGR